MANVDGRRASAVLDYLYRSEPGDRIALCEPSAMQPQLQSDNFLFIDLRNAPADLFEPLQRWTCGGEAWPDGGLCIARLRGQPAVDLRAAAQLLVYQRGSGKRADDHQTSGDQ